MRQLGIGRDLELETVDARFPLRGPVPPPRTRARRRRRTDADRVADRWPFPRAKQAQLIDRLAAARPRAIAIDLQYTEPTDDDDDNALIDSIDRADHVVLATTTVDDQGATNVLGGDALSATSARASAAR